MAGTTTSKRVSIKDFHLPFLIEIGSQIETDDLSEIVNYAITQLKLLTKGNPAQAAQMPIQPARSTTAAAQTDDDLANSLAGILEG